MPVERLRTFHQRMLKGPWPEELPQGKVAVDNLTESIHEARAKYTAALANDLNTAEARAAIFDMVRVVNAAADAGTLRKTDVDEVLKVMELFDGVSSLARVEGQ